MPEEDIERELFEQARSLMALSGLRKTLGHKDLSSDLAMWKKAMQNTDRRGVTHTTYRCPLNYRCNCKCAIRVSRGPQSLELWRSGLHDIHSHENDGSKHLKYDQIISVSDAVLAAPSVSGARLRRNLCLADSPSKQIPAEHVRSVQNRVYKVRKILMARPLGEGDGEGDDSFGALAAFAAEHDWSECVRRHNDPTDEYHLSQFERVVLGSQISPEVDVVRMTLSSPWMLSNALRAIQAGWGFQLNADVTGKICRASLDLLEFGVNSIPCQNNILCLAFIPQATESEATYTLTYNDLRCGVATLCTVEPCAKEKCEFCSKLKELLSDGNVKKFVEGNVHPDQKLPVNTAMCDNFVGWGNFCRKILGIEPNVCKPHGTGRDNASYISLDNESLTSNGGRDRSIAVHPCQILSESCGLRRLL
jgi:hypothetical protein